MLIPPTVVVDARQDAWLSFLISMFPALLLVKLLVSLQKRFPDQSLVQYTDLLRNSHLAMASGKNQDKVIPANRFLNVNFIDITNLNLQ